MEENPADGGSAISHAHHPVAAQAAAGSLPLADNCSLTFAGEIIAGKVNLYSVRHPERTTLSLRKDDVSGEWRIQELRGPDNADVSTETIAYVQSWFAAA